MKNFWLTLLLGASCATALAQTKNFIDQPYLETQATVDTLITPDRIHLTIILNEADTRNKKSTERLQTDMIKVLKELKIDIKEDLTVADFDSDYRNYFLSSKKVLKVKIYNLVVKDAYTLSKVFTGLEAQDISNVSIRKTEYSKKETLLLSLKSKAILKAKANAQALINPLGQKLGNALMILDASSSNYPNAGFVQSLRGQPGSNATISMMQNDEVSGLNFQDLQFSTTISVHFAIE